MDHQYIIAVKDLILMFERMSEKELILIWVGTQMKPNNLYKLVLKKIVTVNEEVGNEGGEEETGKTQTEVERESSKRNNVKRKVDFDDDDPNLSSEDDVGWERGYEYVPDDEAHDASVVKVKEIWKSGQWHEFINEYDDDEYYQRVLAADKKRYRCTCSAEAGAKLMEDIRANPDIPGKAINELLFPIWSIDGTHLKGNYGGILLSTVALDANNEIFPIAYVIVSVEDEGNWNRRREEGEELMWKRSKTVKCKQCECFGQNSRTCKGVN
ncbi:hypothetical protein AgCh_016771 [Apium graveolens]